MFEYGSTTHIGRLGGSHHPMTVLRERPEVPPLGKALHCYCMLDLCAVATVVRSGIHGNALAALQPMSLK
jgi:hypothetical protein